MSEIERDLDERSLPPSMKEVQHFKNLGLEIDATGRPLHPWAGTHLEASDLASGKGAFWKWGPNYTADPIVLTDEDIPRVLLIQRSDTLHYALPGGFVNAHEASMDAALRELEEETGLSDVTRGELIYQGPVADPRTTLHAWPETSAYLFSVDQPQPVVGADDALQATWVPVNELPPLYGSHQELIAKAIEARHTRALLELLEIPETNRTVTPLHLGHMAYDHYITEFNTTKAFVKQHNAALFTDAYREAHSRAYLAKEFWCYEHLRTQSFPHIPEGAVFVDDSLLALTHLAPNEGWHWRAPKESAATYIADVLASFSHLQSLDYPDTAPFHETIHPTYATFWEEGWDTFDESVLASVKERLATFSQNWEQQQQIAAQVLIESLETLLEHAQQQNKYPTLRFAHNDARQSNIAWHPTKGVRLVDWSWADKAPENADATMFLIDMKKAGFDIGPYCQHLNHDYMRTLIGFWLAHSIEPTRDGSTKVREHQAASACTAFTLLAG